MSPRPAPECTYHWESDDGEYHECDGPVGHSTAHICPCGARKDRPIDFNVHDFNERPGLAAAHAKRAMILTALREDGPFVSLSGQATGMLMECLPEGTYDARSLASVLKDMEAHGLIKRDVVAKRTYRIEALV